MEAHTVQSARQQERHPGIWEGSPMGKCKSNWSLQAGKNIPEQGNSILKANALKAMAPLGLSVGGGERGDGGSPDCHSTPAVPWSGVM